MRIGFIGLGNVGAPLATNLVKAGYTLTVYDLRREAAEALIAAGTSWADSPRAVAEKSDAVITALPSPAAVEAALTGDPANIVHAMALDPLTSACCTLQEIREMTIEMLEAQRSWLPQFRSERLEPTLPILIPPDLQRVDVPLDPALVIANRFGELAERQVKKS